MFEEALDDVLAIASARDRCWALAAYLPMLGDVRFHELAIPWLRSMESAERAFILRQCATGIRITV